MRAANEMFAAWPAWAGTGHAPADAPGTIAQQAEALSMLTMEKLMG